MWKHDFFKRNGCFKKQLENFGHQVILPNNTELYASEIFTAETRKESTENKVKNDLIRKYFNEIKESDAVLVINFDKNNVKNYIGGNTFLEMGFAHILDKKIFLLNQIPDIFYVDELLAMRPIIINGDLGKIK